MPASTPPGAPTPGPSGGRAARASLVSPELQLGARLDTLPAWQRANAANFARRVGATLTFDDHIALLTAEDRDRGPAESATRRYVRDVVAPLVARGRLAASHMHHWERRLAIDAIDRRDPDPRVTAWADAKQEARLELLLRVDGERMRVARFAGVPFDVIQPAAFLADVRHFAYNQRTAPDDARPYYLVFRGLEHFQQSARDAVAGQLLLALHAPETVGRLFRLTDSDLAGLQGWAAQAPAKAREALHSLLRVYNLTPALLASAVVEETPGALAAFVTDGLAVDASWQDTESGLFVTIPRLDEARLSGPEVIDERDADHPDGSDAEWLPPWDPNAEEG